MKQREALTKFDFEYPDSSMYGTYMVPAKIIEYSIENQTAKIRFKDSVTYEVLTKTVEFDRLCFTIESVVDPITEEKEEKTYWLNELPSK